MSKVYMQEGQLVVPDQVTVRFIEGDGVGAEISPVFVFSKPAVLIRQTLRLNRTANITGP